MRNSASAWLSGRFERYPALKRNLQVDVVVVGAGITGLVTAYLLKMAGKRVCVLERDRIAHGDTGVTTAHVTAVIDLLRATQIKRFNLEAAQAVWSAGMTAIQTIEDIARDAPAACDFQRVPGFLHVPAGTKGDRDLGHEWAAVRRLGIAADWVTAPLVQQPAIRFADQALFDPAKLARALARAISGRGSHIFERSEVTQFTHRPRGVKSNECAVRCRHIIVATHVPMSGNTEPTQAALLQSKLIPTSTYAVEATLARPLPAASFWDTADPYRYLRIDHTRSGTRAIFGGEDHKTGQADDVDERWARLAAQLTALLPDAKLRRHWSGQVIETVDGLPYIGESAPGQFIATGFSGNGMTWGVVAAMMARSWVLGKRHPLQELLRPDRKKWRSGWRYLAENFDYPYYLIRDRLKRNPVASPHDLPKNQAAVLQVEWERVACYRDDRGSLHAVSAVCTHLGCLVRWNRAESTWDCPCHGSRFQPDGAVVAGPAEEPLQKHDL